MKIVEKMQKVKAYLEKEIFGLSETKFKPILNNVYILWKQNCKMWEGVVFRGTLSNYI